MSAVFVIWGWCRSFCRFLFEPSAEEISRADKERRARARKHAEEVLRGR